jgi:tritrans,polycis-undecaprenyl-diphosphate synthase [geranylgeranyl-diphosphate specific]
MYRGINTIAEKNQRIKKYTQKKLHKIEKYAINSDVGQNLISVIYHSKIYSFLKDRINQFRTVKLIEEINNNPKPEHIAIIMDGNRRYARNKGLSPGSGHKFGRDKVEETLNWCFDLGIKNLTLYAFSKENFNRPSHEVKELMNLCRHELDKAINDSKIHKNKVKVKVIGHFKSLPKDIQKSAKYLMDKTKEYDNHILTIALAYSGREEIVNAIQSIAEDVRDEKIEIPEIDEKKVSSYLYTDGTPDPDLILRTSGEERISNFFLWQMAYSEFYFTDVYWPEFQKIDFLNAIHNYQQRKRRYGK